MSATTPTTTASSTPAARVTIPLQRSTSPRAVRVARPDTARPQRGTVDLEVVVPAYNESRRLPATLQAMTTVLAELPLQSRIVVVDNGSSDDTAAAVAVSSGGRVEITVIGCAEPGKGAAVLRGLRTSRARWVGFTDADLSTPVTTIGPALAALEAGATAAIASRRAPGATLATAQPLARRLGGTAFRALARPLVRGVHDTQCGFKFFDREAAAAAFWECRSTGFAFDVELLHRLLATGGTIAEIPVTWAHESGSTLRPVRDGIGALLAVARMHQARPAGRVAP